MNIIEETIQEMTEQKGFKHDHGTKLTVINKRMYAVINGTDKEKNGDQKQINGKPRYFNRVDVSACIDPVARVRSANIDKLKKYPESMQWRDIPAGEWIDAIQRHLDKIYEAGDPFAVDEETGCFHLDAIAFNHMVCEIKRTGRERGIEGDKADTGLRCQECKWLNENAPHCMGCKGYDRFVLKGENNGTI